MCHTFKFWQYKNVNIANFVHYGKTRFGVATNMRGKAKHLMVTAFAVNIQFKLPGTHSLQCRLSLYTNIDTVYLSACVCLTVQRITSELLKLQTSLYLLNFYGQV